MCVTYTSSVNDSEQASSSRLANESPSPESPLNPCNEIPLPLSSTPCSSRTILEPLIVSPAKARQNESTITCLSSDGGTGSSLVSEMSANETSMDNVQVTVNSALTSHIEQLKAENLKLHNELTTAKLAPFRIECIRHDNALITLYTGFPSYDVFMAFFRFLEPSVDQLHVWGKTRVKRRTKFDPLNQLFMTLVKLKLYLQ